MQLNEQDTRPAKVKEPFIPWEGVERVKPDWVPIKHGETIAPQCDQKSNLDLSDEQVLQPRTEPIVSGSQATPINGRHDTGHGASDEPSGAKRTYPTSGGIPL